MDPDPELYSDDCLQAAGALLQSFHGTSIYAGCYTDGIPENMWVEV
jgi:hypothetical protein